MHINTHEVFNATFKRTALDRVLKHGKVPENIIKEVQSMLTEAEPGEVALAHVILTLLKRQELRRCWAVYNDDYTQVFAIGLANDADEVQRLLKSQFDWSLMQIAWLDRTDFNDMLQDPLFSTWTTFGM